MDKIFDLAFKIAGEIRAELVGQASESYDRDHWRYYMGGADALEEFEKRFREQAGAVNQMIEPVNEKCICGADVKNWTGEEPFIFCPDCGIKLNWGGVGMKFKIGDFVQPLDKSRAPFVIEKIIEQRISGWTGRVYYEMELEPAIDWQKGHVIDYLNGLILETEIAAQSYETVSELLGVRGRNHDKVRAYYTGRLKALHEIKEK